MFKKLLFLLIPFTFLLNQTYINEDIGVNDTWSTDGNPYYLQDDIRIHDGIVLTIEEGVELYILGNNEITLSPDASFIANGTEENNIIIEPIIGPSQNYWGGFVVEASSNLEFNYVNINSADNLVRHDIFAPNNIGIHFYNSIISHVGTAINLNIANDATIEIISSSLSTSEYMFYIQDSSVDVNISFSTLETPWNGIRIGNGVLNLELHDCIFNSGERSLDLDELQNNSNINIYNNYFSGNFYDSHVIDLNQHPSGGNGVTNFTLDIHHNLFDSFNSANQNKAMINFTSFTANSGGADYDYGIYNNTFIGDPGEARIGIQLYEVSSNVQYLENNVNSNFIYNNIFHGLNIAIDCENFYDIAYNIMHNNFYENDYNIYGVSDQGQFGEQYSEFFTNLNGDPSDANMNIYLDPSFEGDDYQISALSPCIDAGYPGIDVDLDGTIHDIGYAWFNQIGVDLGCMDETACNYDSSANVDNGSCLFDDCSGECDGTAILDDCGVCNGGNADMDECGVCFGEGAVYECGCSDIPDGQCDCDGNVLDCSGECDGTAILDDCGVCNGGNADQDCAGNCFGDSALDDCGVCDGGNADQDCAGNCFGDSALDDAGGCCLDNERDCAGVCFGDAVDVPGGCCLDNERDCAGVCFGDAVEDECGDCSGPGPVYECGCTDIPDGDCDCEGNILDECGICDGLGSVYECGCTDIPDGDCDCNGNIEDCTGECGGNIEVDCECVCGGDTELDACGECNGNNACSISFSSESHHFDGATTTMIPLDITDPNLIDLVINDLNIEIDYNSDHSVALFYTRIQLLSPNNTVIPIAHGSGVGQNPNWDSSDGSILFNTVFDDEASTFIYDGFSPFPGSYYGDEQLSTFDDEPILGTWNLFVQSAEGDVDGEVNFTLTFTLGEYGCTDLSACNYDQNANTDDDSCEYAEENFDCDGNCIVDIDCNGECGGDAIVDECGECNGDGDESNCVLFTKEDFADETLSENQDCIVENICLTRGLTEPLYNAVYYSGYSDMMTSYSLGDSVLIKWAEGTVNDAELGNLNFVNSLQEIGGLTNITSKDIVGYIVNLDIYLNFNFLQWTVGEPGCSDCTGGGFSYIRDIVICDNENDYIDCAGECGGDAIIDECGECGGSGIADGACDCEGNVLDECGECNGDGINEGECDCEGNVEDCEGVCGGDAIVDECGECNGDGFCNPVIYEIIDIPEDQGGRVYVSFYSSSADTDTLRNEMYSVERLDMDSVWVNIVSGPAYGENEYTFEVSTLLNTNDNQDGTTSFRVIAAMEEGNWQSNVEEGYSVDNIAPYMPEDFDGEFDSEEVTLAWTANTENDLMSYEIFRNDEFIGTTTETSFTDDNLPENTFIDYYIVALDENYNASETSDIYYAHSYSGGDINSDSSINIQDIILTLDFILGSDTLIDEEFEQADLNDSGSINIQDIIIMIGLILGF